METIGKIKSVKINKDGMIAKISLDDTLRNKVLLNLFNLEDKIFFLEFKSIGIAEMIKELKEKNCNLTANALEMTQKKIKKEIKEINKSMKNLSKLL